MVENNIDNFKFDVHSIIETRANIYAIIWTELNHNDVVKTQNSAIADFSATNEISVSQIWVSF